MELKYQLLANQLIRDVRAGKWPLGAKMPTERHLVEITGHSMTTVRRAYDLLVEQGIVERRPGAGTFVTRTSSWHSSKLKMRVGTLVPDVHQYFGAVLQGMERRLSAARAEMVLATYDYSPEKEWDAIQRLLDSGVDGLLLTPSPMEDPSTSPMLNLVTQLGVPTVVTERDVEFYGDGAHFSSVLSDHAGGAADAVNHLVALGHTHIGLAYRNQRMTAPMVVRGFRGAASNAHVSTFEFELPPSPSRASIASLATEISAQSVSALLVFGDAEAIQLQAELRRRSIHTPEDISLIAYDDETAHLAEVPITAVGPAKHRVGETAAEMLLRMISEGEAFPSQQVRIRPRLVERSSCTALGQIAR